MSELPIPKRLDKESEIEKICKYAKPKRVGGDILAYCKNRECDRKGFICYGTTLWTYGGHVSDLGMLNCKYREEE